MLFGHFAWASLSLPVLSFGTAVLYAWACPAEVHLSQTNKNKNACEGQTIGRGHFCCCYRASFEVELRIHWWMAIPDSNINSLADAFFIVLPLSTREKREHLRVGNCSSIWPANLVSKYSHVRTKPWRIVLTNWKSSISLGNDSDSQILWLRSI